MISKIRNKNGFTVVELLITIVIAAIVFSLALSLQFFGVRSYSMGTSQAEVQQNARLIDEVIRRELRNAIYIGNDPSNGVRTINFSNDTLQYGKQNETNVFFELEGITNITFNRKEERILGYTIKGNGYELKNEILLNNLTLEEGISIGFPIYYRLPGD